MKRVECLEGVRGIASIMVLLNHLCVMFYPAYYWNIEMNHCYGLDYYLGHTPFAFILNGNSGVILFLIITGFGSYTVCQKGIDSIKKYVTLRYFKLLIISVIASFIVWFLANNNFTYYQDIIEITKTPWFNGFEPLLTSYISLLKNDPLSSLSNYNENILWTMKYFFIGSFLSLFLSIIGQNSSKRYYIYILSILVLINMQQLYYVACVVGVILADYYSTNSQYNCSSSAGIIILLLGVYLCAYPTGAEPSLWCYSFLPFKYMLYYHLIGAGCIIFSALFYEKLTNLLSTKVFQFLGKYSLSIYIVHYGILISFSAYLFMKLQVAVGYNVNCLITFISTIVLVLFLSLLIEKIIKFLYKHLDNVYNKFFI